MKNSEAKKAADLMLRLLVDGMKKQGYAIRFGGGQVGTGRAVLRFEVTCLGHDPDKADFEKYCGLFQLTPEHYKKEAIVYGQKMTLIGLKPSRPTFPVLLKRADGKVFKHRDEVLTSFR